LARPLAVTIEEAAELLGRSARDMRRTARHVEPDRHADGSACWPLRELARVLADAGGPSKGMGPRRGVASLVS
jgi:hypothetical protein